MVWHLLTRGQLLLIVALGGRAEYHYDGHLHQVYPQNFTWADNSVDEHSNIMWGRFSNRALFSSSIKNCTATDLLINDVSSAFISLLQSQKLPADLVTNLLTQTLMIDDTDDKFNELMSYMSRYMAWFVLWLSLSLALPWLGLCALVAHKHGFLGATRHQKYLPNRNLRRKELSCALMFFTFLIWYGAMIGHLSSNKLVNTVGTTQSVLLNHIGDMREYLDSSLREIEHVLLDNFDYTSHVVRRDLASVGFLVGGNIKTFLQTGDGLSKFNRKDFVTNLEYLLNLTHTHVPRLLHFITTVLSAKRKESDELRALLKTEIDKIRAVQKNTAACPKNTACGQLNPSVIELNMDFNKLPNLTANERALRNISRHPGRTYRTLKKGILSLEGIVYKLERSAESLITAYHYMDTGYKQVVADTLAGLMKLKNRTMLGLEYYEGKVDELIDEVSLYSRLFWVFGLLVFTVTTLVVTLQTIGLAIGTLAYKNAVVSTTRSKLSDTGGYILMVCVTVMFSVSWLMLVTGWMSMPCSCYFKKVYCDPLLDPDQAAIKTLTTGPSSPLWGHEGYYLGDLVLDNPSTKLDLSKMISRCRANQPMMRVLMYSSVLDVRNVTSHLTKLVDMSRLLLSYTAHLPDIVILDKDLEDVMANIILGFRANFVSIVDMRKLIDIADKLKKLAEPTGKYQKAVESQLEFAKTMTQLKDDLTDVPAVTLSTSQAMVRVKKTIEKQGPSLVYAELGKFRRRLNYILNQYKNNTEHVYRVGRCGSFYKKHKEFVQLGVCTQLITPFYGFGLSLVWCGLWMLASIPINLLLAPYFHIMTITELKELEALDPEAAKRYREKGMAKPVNLREKLNQTYNMMSNYFYGMTSKIQTLRKQDLMLPVKISGGDKS